MKFILADQSLVSFTGHSFEYAQSIRNIAHSLGCEVIVLASKDVKNEVRHEINAIPCFTYGLDHRFDSLFFRGLPDNISKDMFPEWNYLRHNQTLYKDLVVIDKRLEINADTFVVFHTIRHNHILPIVRWVEQLSPPSRPKVVLVFHFTAYPNFTESSLTEKFYRRALSCLKKSSASKQFKLFADSKELVEEYQTHTDLPVNLVPIPHASAPSSSETGLSVTYREYDHPIRLTYLGDARINKGFHLLPYVFRKLEKLLQKGEIVAELQANVRDDNEWQVRLAVNQLKQQRGVKLHDTNLSSVDYYDLLKNASIILLPYTLDYYHSQTSGIFSEALASGKPVIVPRGTWMARQIKSDGAGVTFIPQDRHSLYEAILEAINKYGELSEKSRQRSLQWRQFHCPETYFDTIARNF